MPQALIDKAPQSRRSRTQRYLRVVRPLDSLPVFDLESVDLGPLDPGWRKRAVCRGKGRTPEGIKLWYPGPGGAHRGKLYCDVCPVKRECKAFADEFGITYGIWGGEIRHRDPQKRAETGQL